jgi:hypothetical protein
VRADVGQGVPVGRPAAEVAAFDVGLGGHGGADPDLDPVPLAFGDAAEHAHDQVVGLVVGVDRAADLGHPQRHAVVGKQRVGVAELVAVERPLRLPHHHRVKSTVGVGQRGKQTAGLGPALRRDRPRLVDVEELRDDDATGRLDQRLAAGVLPRPGRLRDLAGPRWIRAPRTRT